MLFLNSDQKPKNSDHRFSDQIGDFSRKSGELQKSRKTLRYNIVALTLENDFLETLSHLTDVNFPYIQI